MTTPEIRQQAIDALTQAALAQGVPEDEARDAAAKIVDRAVTEKNGQ